MARLYITLCFKGLCIYPFLEWFGFWWVGLNYGTHCGCVCVVIAEQTGIRKSSPVKTAAPHEHTSHSPPPKQSHEQHAGMCHQESTATICLAQTELSEIKCHTCKINQTCKTCRRTTSRTTLGLVKHKTSHPLHLIYIFFVTSTSVFHLQHLLTGTWLLIEYWLCWQIKCFHQGAIWETKLVVLHSKQF